jgi:hypothetical protein
MDFHDLIHKNVNGDTELFMIKRNANVWNIPRRLKILNDTALLKINEL